jgi:hypothetical protein
MDRVYRSLRREQLREFRRFADEQNAHIRRLEARCESLEAALQNCIKLNDAMQERTETLKEMVKLNDETVEDLSLKATVRGNQLQLQEKILLRARHLEVHCEHLSLWHPAVPDATLPHLSFEEWCYWKNMEWCTDEKEAEKVWELEGFHFDHAVHTEDYRIPSVHALINGIEIPRPDPPHARVDPEPRFLSHVPICDPPSPRFKPQGRDRSRSPVRGRRSRSVTPFAADGPTDTEDSGSRGFGNVSKEEDVIGPSSG